MNNEYSEKLQKLNQARKNNELVVFAGSGISKSEPSNIPLLPEICRNLSELYNEPIIEDNLKLYLDKLIKKYGPEVEEEYICYLLPPDSKPNILHKSIIKLFNANNLRIITTNNDVHLTTEAREAFGSFVETFENPITPSDANFNGIVYIHGTTLRTLDRILIGAADHERVYWDPPLRLFNFLTGVMQERVVVFIGVGFEDPEIRFVATRISQFGRRNLFAIVIEDEVDRLEDTNIELIQYKVYEGENRHYNLIRLMISWVEDIEKERSNKGVL